VRKAHKLGGTLFGDIQDQRSPEEKESQENIEEEAKVTERGGTGPSEGSTYRTVQSI